MSLVATSFAQYEQRLSSLPIEPPEPPQQPRRAVLCACGCKRYVYVDDYVHYVDEDGNTFYDRDCVDKFYGIRCVD